MVLIKNPPVSTLLTYSFFLSIFAPRAPFSPLVQLECGNLMHERARKADDVDNQDHSRNKRTVVPFPFPPISSVKRVMPSPTASHVSPASSYLEDRRVSADMPFQSVKPESHLVQLPAQESIARAGGGEVITHIASHFGVRRAGVQEEGEEETRMESESENVATLDQLMDESLSLECLTTPGVLILVVVLTCILLAVSTMSVCLSIRVKELAQQLEIRQSRQLHESFSIKTSPFAFAATTSPTSTASSSPTSCLFDQETILPVQTVSSKQRE